MLDQMELQTLREENAKLKDEINALQLDIEGLEEDLNSVEADLRYEESHNAALEQKLLDCDDALNE